jgi:hypothetical protein
VVVINQGSNDRGTTGASFAALYASYLGIIRAAYPSAKLVAEDRRPACDRAASAAELIALRTDTAGRRSA